jgi:hypothetical protein
MTHTERGASKTRHAVVVAPPSRSLVRRVAIGVGGSSLLVVGVAGLVLPIIPGALFVASGLTVLGREFVWARTTLTRVFPSRFVRSARDEAREAEAA